MENIDNDCNTDVQDLALESEELEEDKLDDADTDSDAEEEPEFLNSGRGRGSMAHKDLLNAKNLDATQLYLNEIGFSPCSVLKRRFISPVGR